MSTFWFRARKFLIQKVLHAGDTPHAIALGAAIAMLVTFLPVMGLQTVIAIGVAALFRANKAVCIPIVWITNPLTAGPIYLACLGLGRFVMASPAGAEESVVLSGLERQHSVGIFELAFWKNLLYLLGSLGAELWIGCVIVGTVFGVASYFLARWGVTTYRERRRRRLLRRGLFRATLQKSDVARGREPA